MSPRRSRQFMMLAILGVWTLSGAVLYWGWQEEPMPQPDKTRAETASSANAEQPDNQASPSPTLTTTSFASLWERPLRRVLYDPPPPPKPEPPPKRPPPRIQVKVLATMIEASQQTAMIQLNGGAVVFRKVGEAVSPDHESATIEDIKPGAVVIRQGEHLSEYVVDDGSQR